jgi:hypothetical protein
MTPELARIALAFLDRTDMKGAEVQAYVAVVNALREIMQSQLSDERPAATSLLPRAGNGAEPHPEP